MIVKIVNLKRCKIGRRPRLWWRLDLVERYILSQLNKVKPLEARLGGMVDGIVLIKSIWLYTRISGSGVPHGPPAGRVGLVMQTAAPKSREAIVDHLHDIKTASSNQQKTKPPKRSTLLLSIKILRGILRPIFAQTFLTNLSLSTTRYR